MNDVELICKSGGLQMGIANRDIKLENTLLMDTSERPLVKLCDFGYSKDEYQGSACKTLCGEFVFHTYFLHALVCFGVGCLSQGVK